MENPAPKDASMASVQGSTGVDQDRGMCEEKRTDDRFSIVGTLNSGGPECDPSDCRKAVRRPLAINAQEDANRTFRESDPPIVVRDGNAGHRAKERAGSNASTGITTGHEYSRRMVSNSLLAMGIGSGTLCRAGSACALS